MDEKIIEIIKEDIQRCEDQTVNEGSYQLYQALMGKYNGYFPGFSKDIPKSGKMSTGGAFNYRPELNAIKEKLKFLLVTEQNKDPLYRFKGMMSNDIELLRIAVEEDTMEENEKQRLYLSVTSKYHSYVPQLGDGLYQYYADQGLYEKVSDDTLDFNLNSIYNKLVVFQSLNYPGLGATVANVPSTIVNITNSNENNNTISISFDKARETVYAMTSLPEKEIEEIQKQIDEIEKIVNSTESKSKKWSKAKEIVKWIADKGVDVGIALLPLLLKIS